MKPHRKACSLTAAIITLGSLVGGANAALIFSVEESGAGVKTVLTGISFTTVGLTSVGSDSGSGTSTFIAADQPWVGFTGSTDVPETYDQAWTIPPFTFFDGSGSSATNATMLSLANPFIAIWGAGELRGSSSNPLPSDFVATAFYDGRTIDDLGIDTTPQTIVLANGQELRLFQAVPEPSSALLFGLGALGMLARRKRTN
ncbi:PEP-CTERM sorting domain-containing protein [bacterium]|nr:PEP-CTERM sorting domain-containing protein [Akkermansiaceae bacterium]MDB4311661.1 PEP-CTERM sorting domain-containing protein [bacterium]MDB4525470.1 PEP-CTERM sorting domain-containing protein [Akkermansiaceae bacterium]MDB4546850.1 PEP-CTERM sorting domain-containing protein [Akkermansiaceae bacterium]MDB4587922.1 PEP-CTERM sorting domain-containing protein [bacterium]